MGLVGADAIAHHLGLAGGHAGAAVGAGVTVDEIVFDAAARDTAHHASVAAQGHHRADRARGGAPGASDRGQQGAMASGEPVSGGAQNQQINAFHGVPLNLMFKGGYDGLFAGKPAPTGTAQIS
ncbi:hypothetical protein D3C76_1105140 [compost metagenome]